ncbi:MAG TPA: hydroxymethylbilane synthase [Bacteroidia bacterium]|nr:hydroxymethylbilane synthase [Bacteroidia bacterium]
MRTPLIIGTRGSDLALWQARHVQSLLKKIGLESELKIIKTQGDEIQHLSFDKLEGKGFFTKEIEDALLNGITDIAVHSHKDLPTEGPAELMIAAVSEREDPSELLLILKDKVDPKRKFQLKKDALVGTSSNRRKVQLLAFRSDVTIKDLRGNVPTRIAKLREGQYDAILIAAAGVERLGLDLSDLHVERLDPTEFIPAPAQGVLAIQVRKKDTELQEHLKKIHSSESATLTYIEREVLHLFKGGCQMPIGVLADYDEETETYKVRVSRAQSGDKLPASIYAESKDAEVLAQRVLDKILQVRACQVFISREVNQGSYLRNVMEANGFQLEARSLIETNSVPFGQLPDTGWIFFSSKQAVKYFFGQNPVLGDQKFACVGKSTSEALRRYNKRAEFIGASTDTKMIGKQFAAKAGASKVLFPQAKGSMRSVQQQFVKSDQIVDLVVYETIKKNSGQAPDAQILVFTSPSNVEAWFEVFKVQKTQQVIAMGDATAHSLRKYGVIMISKTDSFDEAGLARAIFSASSR